MKKSACPKPYILTNLFIVAVACYLLFGVAACKKYLDAKPNQAIATPSTIGDLEGIINDYSFINARFPSAAEVSSDNYYLTSADWNALSERQHMYYIWQKYDDIGGDYTSPYQAIEYANIVLDALPGVSGGDVQARNEVQGDALYIRASLHYALAQLFAKVYIKTEAATDLGIALRLTSDVQVKPVRSTVAETYNSILADLHASVALLPSSPDVKYRASKPAAYGMLARVYLAMSDYSNAGLYADSALDLYNKLIDYNSISPTAIIPFMQFNDEVIYDARTSAAQALSAAKAKIDTLLYASYGDNDLRKTILFKSNANGSKAFKGNYTGLNNAACFTGIATNELYLIKAETAVRNGNAAVALQTLNALLVTRWRSGTYLPYALTDPAQILNLILQERRKELLFRTLRWTDLRRLNLDPNQATILTRNLSDTTYRLLPGSPRYIFEIDQNAVDISGLVQNP